MSNEEVLLPPQSFSSIQSRRVLGTLEALELCPSMDLCVYHTSTSTDIPLYRTISWQRVAIIRQDDTDTSSSTTTTTTTTMMDPCSRCCWSPSGRWIAVARERNVHLYGVEPLANPPEGYSGSNEATAVQHGLESSAVVTGLYWAHVGRAHPTAWNSSEDEAEDDLSWRYQSHYVDSTQFFLPPSGYLLPNDEDDHERHQEQTTTTALPESNTPLSVLCVSTDSNIELYLHGRYRLLQLDSLVAPSQVSMSHDLSYLMVASANNSQLSLFHLPFLKQDRYPLQIVASLHASITAHLATLQQSIVECANSWKTSLKPLDTKLQPLHRLLANYGVDDQPLGVILKQYILVGHTSESSSVANAIDQFFTGIQMNDQLLQRMERSLHSALANVEGQARKGLLSPTQAMCYQVHELVGHMRLHRTTQFDHDQETTDAAIRDLLNATNQLWISVHTLLLSMVQGRLHIRDFCAWLRSAGSQIKARGTALNSVQRENAKKRRVPQAVLERLLGTMNTKPLEAGASLSEHLLKISTSTLLKDTETLIPLPTTKSWGSTARPESPSSVLGLVTSTPTVTHAVKLTRSTFERAFNNPLSNIPHRIARQEISIQPSPVMALHMRVGADRLDYDALNQQDQEGESSPKSYFLPKAHTSESDEGDYCYCRQWSVVATAQENAILLHAIPLGWKPSEDDTLVMVEGDNQIPFYLTAKLGLPFGGSIRDIGFYGDDGKSSLSSGNDSGTGKEGHQKLGVLYEIEGQLDLWLTSYDRIRWQSVQFYNELLDASNVRRFATVALQGMVDKSAENGDVPLVQTRRISTIEKPEAEVKLMLCGSRGVGAIAVASEGVTSIELLDIEEDEGEEDVEYVEDEE